MHAPAERIHIGGCELLILGTIPGYLPDGDRVRTAIRDFQPDAVALGVPSEDLASVAALAADPTLADGLEPDYLDARLLELLQHWGPTQAIPSPDLAEAEVSGLPLIPIDMEDEEHTNRYTETVKMRHLAARGRVRKRLEKGRMDDAGGPYELVDKWDRALFKIRPIGELELEREKTMANNLQDVAKTHKRILAIVHVARWQGLFTALSNGP